MLKKMNKWGHNTIFNEYFLFLTLFFTGAAILVLEILGTRVLSPYFGVGLYVWSALITVTLMTLALGYWRGGLLADKNPGIQAERSGKTWQKLYFLILLAGIFILAIPPASPALLESLSLLGIKTGVLLSALVLFGPPLLLLGMVTPYAVKLCTPELGVLGSRVGCLYAVSTVGSCCGALLTGFVLIPHMGVSRVFYLLSLVLFLLWAARLVIDKGCRAGISILPLSAALILFLSASAGFSAVNSGKPYLLGLNFFGMFFFSVLKKNNAANNHCNAYSNEEKNSQLIHYHSPLSMNVPVAKNKIKPIIPKTNPVTDILSGVAILPIISAIKIAWPKFKNTLAKFSLCFFVNRILKNILPALQTSVKQKLKKFCRQTKKEAELFSPVSQKASGIHASDTACLHQRPNSSEPRPLHSKCNSYFRNCQDHNFEPKTSGIHASDVALRDSLIMLSLKQYKFNRPNPIYQEQNLEDDSCFNWNRNFDVKFEVQFSSFGEFLGKGVSLVNAGFDDFAGHIFGYFNSFRNGSTLGNETLQNRAGSQILAIFQ